MLLHLWRPRIDSRFIGATGCCLFQVCNQIWVIEDKMVNPFKGEFEEYRDMLAEQAILSGPLPDAARRPASAPDSRRLTLGVFGVWRAARGVRRSAPFGPDFCHPGTVRLRCCGGGWRGLGLRCAPRRFCRVLVGQP